MEGKVKCSGCGHSWDKSDSTKKDMFICHQCGKDNVMKNGGWLNKYNDGGFVQPNANDSKVSMSEDFVGLGYNTKGRNYSPAWGGQFQDGGELSSLPLSQQLTSFIPKDNIEPTLPYTTTKDPEKFLKSWIQNPEFERRQLLTGYLESPNISRGIPAASEIRKTRLRSLDKLNPITYSDKEPSKAKPGYNAGISYININPSDYIGTSKEAVRAHEVAHIGGATNVQGHGMSSMEEDIFKESMLPLKEPNLFGVQGSKEREASIRNLEDFKHLRKPYEAKADLDALRFMMYDKGVYDITKGKKFTEKDFEKAKENLGKDRVFKRLTDRVGKKNFVNLMNTIAFVDDKEASPIAMNGASMPGSVGFTYARTAGSAPSEGKYAKKTMASAQSGKDIDRVSTSDPRYAELYKNRQVGSFYDGAYSLPDLPEFVVEGKDERVKEAMARTSQGFLQGVLNTLSAPQEVTMDLLTGKQQAPSEAFGFQQTGGWLDSPTSFGKNLSNFAMDGVLDPLNLLGTGVFKNASKLAGKSTSKKVIPSNVLDSGVKLTRKSIRSIVEDIKKGSDLTGTGYDIDPFYHKGLFEEKKKQVIDRLSTDKGKERLKNFIDENYKKNPENFGTVNSKFLPWLRSGFKDYTKINPDMVIEDLKKMEFVPRSYGNSGKDNAFHWFDKGVGNSSVMNIGELNTPYDALHIFEHELAHLFQRTKASNVDDILSQLKLKKQKGPSRLNLYKSEAPLTEAGYSQTRTDPNYINFNSPLDYFNRGSDGQEKMPFVAELRENLLQRGIINDYYDDVTPELLKKHKNIYDKTGGSKYIQRIYEIIEDSPENFDILSKALNKMPQVVLPVAGGAAVVTSALQQDQPVQQQMDGGITKDNRGYWNSDNWGKPVEINSNNITMEGVYEPLLGVSDTGDTKLMKPGKNYKFKGKKVTEFPVAKNGAWLDSYRSGGRVGINDLDAQPIKKLNQLTNFTNNPDKDNWLNKYN